MGAGIDSYYEYLLKAYILLGDDLFLQRFNIVRTRAHTHTHCNLRPLRLHNSISLWHRQHTSLLYLILLCLLFYVWFSNFQRIFVAILFVYITHIIHPSLCMSCSALCIYNEVHKPAAAAAGRPHPQTSASRSHLDGLSAGLLPWTAGRIAIGLTEKKSRLVPLR